MTTDSFITLVGAAIILTAVSATNYWWHRLVQETTLGFASFIVLATVMVLSVVCIAAIVGVIFPFDQANGLQVTAILLSITFGVPIIQVWIMDLGERQRHRDLAE